MMAIGILESVVGYSQYADVLIPYVATNCKILFNTSIKFLFRFNKIYFYVDSEQTIISIIKIFNYLLLHYFFGGLHGIISDLPQN